MAYKVSFNSGTGHDDVDEENGDGKFGRADVIEFDTEEERRAFILGVNMVAEVTNGWADAWIEVKSVGDKHGNLVAKEGCDRCPCGSKYWENDRCVDCGASPPK